MSRESSRPPTFDAHAAAAPIIGIEYNNYDLVLHLAELGLIFLNGLGDDGWERSFAWNRGEVSGMAFEDVVVDLEAGAGNH